jgi:hypothetical protein
MGLIVNTTARNDLSFARNAINGLQLAQTVKGQSHPRSFDPYHRQG